MTKNINYRRFLDEGEIKFFEEGHLKLALENVKGIRGKYIKEGRCLLIALYYTGARPVEVLSMLSTDLERDGSYIKVRLKGRKRGLTRPMWLQSSRPLVKELYAYSMSLMPNMYMFYHYRGKYHKTYMSRKKLVRHYVETTYKLRYYFKKWFEGVFPGGINPYYFRHNAFSKMSERGATPQEIKQAKGAKSSASVDPYLHMSARSGKKLARLNR